jgi:hypothetical protein
MIEGVRGMIFRDLLDMFTIVTSNLKNKNIFGADRQLEHKKAEALKQIVDYAIELDWIKHQYSKDRLKYFFNSGFEYQITADHFGVSKNSIEASVSYSAKKFEKLIGGKATLNLIKKGQIEEAITQFNIATGKVNPDDWFIDGVNYALPTPKDGIPYKLQNFRKELNFLSLFSKVNFKALVKAQNQENLSHLLYILNSTESKYASERDILCKLLKGEFSNYEGVTLSIDAQVTDAIKAFQSKNIYYRE